METFRCGHPRSPENTSKNGKGTTYCRTCKRARDKARRDADPDPEGSRARAHEQMMRRRRAKGVQEGHHNARKTHCPGGHPYDEENTYVTPAGVRQCKVCRRAALRRDYLKHKERRDAANRAWAANNPERVSANNRAWRLANPERAALLGRLKWQRRRAAGVLTIADWKAVLALYGTTCLACGSDDPPTIDHVVPISKGGTNTVENVQPLCMDCNNRKGTKTIDYRPEAAVV